MLMKLRIFLCAALVCAGVCLLLDRALPEAVGTGRVFLRLAVCAGASLAAYALCCFLLRVRAMRTLANELLKRR